MKYRQLTSGERYVLSALRKQGYTNAAIARALGRHRSTIGREVRRNSKPDGGYRANVADEKTRGRRRRSRQHWRFSWTEWELVISLLKEDWSPDQISGYLKRTGQLRISHETIYRFVWDDRARGGALYDHFRQRAKRRRKRYGAYDSRGKLAGKRAIAERPPGAQNRSRVGHFEGDTVMGSSKDTHCILTLVDRKTGFVIIGKLESRCVEVTNRKAIELINAATRTVRTVTVDNGTEFHGFKDIEKHTGSRFFFAKPYHSWERGSSENVNGLIRQYLPKRKSMKNVTQEDCDRIAAKLNSRPRLRLHYRSPEECHA